MSTISILGNQGHFGSFLQTLFLPHSLQHCDPFQLEGCDLQSTPMLYDTQLSNSEHVIPCFPLHIYHSLLADTYVQLATLRARQGLHTTLWIISSLQGPAWSHVQRVISLCSDAIQQYIHIVGFHPMFGPQSFATNPRINQAHNLQNVFTFASSEYAQQQAEKLIECLKKQGIGTITVPSPIDHDRIVASTQGLVFRFALFAEEDPIFSALLQQYFPHLFFTFQQDTALMRAFVRLNPYTHDMSFKSAWQETGRSTREDILRTFRHVDTVFNPQLPIITTRSYNELRALSQSID